MLSASAARDGRRLGVPWPRPPPALNRPQPCQGGPLCARCSSGLPVPYIRSAILPSCRTSPRAGYRPSPYPCCWNTSLSAKVGRMSFPSGPPGRHAWSAICRCWCVILTRAAPGDPSRLLGDGHAEDLARVQKVYGLDNRCCAVRSVCASWAHGNLGELDLPQRPVTPACCDFRAHRPSVAEAIALPALVRPACGSFGCVPRAVHRPVFTGFAMSRHRVPSSVRPGADSDFRGPGWFPVRGTASPRVAGPRAPYPGAPPPCVVLNSALIIRFTRASMLAWLG